MCVDFVVAEDDVVDDTTPDATPEGCVKVYECCERNDEECVTYCEPTIECEVNADADSESTTQGVTPFQMIGVPCRKGFKSIGGTCRRAF